MLAVNDKSGGFNIDRMIKLDYDQADRITLKNLLDAYDSQVKEFYRCLDMISDDRYDEDFVEKCLEEANDIMSHLERVIEYYSVPDTNYCEQIRADYEAKRKMSRMNNF